MSVETRLVEWLERTTPEPPRQISVEDVAALVRRPTRWQPLLAAALVLVLAGVVVTIVARARHRPAAPVATRVVSAASSAVTSPPSRSASPRAAVPSLAGLPWRATSVGALRLSARLDNAVLAVGSTLVAYDSQLGSLTRIDVGTGRTITRNTVLRSSDTAMAGPVLADGQIWLAARSGSNAVRVAGYDGRTLQVRHRLTLHGFHFTSASLAVIAANGDAIYVGAGTEIVSLSAHSGMRTGGWAVDGANGGIDGIAASGGKVYVGTNDGGGSGFLLVYPAKPDATSNTPLSQQATPVRPIAASGGGVWVSFSGGNTTTVGYRGAGAALTASVGGGNGLVGMTISGATAWLTSPSEVVCADPATGRVRSRVRVGQGHGSSSWLSQITVVQGRTFALAAVDDAVHGDLNYLVELQPPASCR